ncbi:MAG TPA: flagellin [Rhodanobacteraceae bacterium]|nr:flagellin [Rhodanobacteraceae bacterium]
MAVINTNITALIGQQNLTKSASALQTAMERLSSGLRINSAADDAAGQAIANRMSAQITGLSQAQRNANDGISVAQTAGGALNQVNDNLQRIRQLTVQAANGTNSASDLASIQDEINQRLDEINRVSTQTSFNGVNVLASNQTLNIQVGANDGQVIGIKLNQINRSTLGLDGFDVTKQVTSSTLAVVGANVSEAASAASVKLSYAAPAGTYSVVISNDNKLYVQNTATSKYYSATFNAGTNRLTFSTGTSVAAPTAGGSTFIDANNNIVSAAQLAAAAKVDGAAGATFSMMITASGQLFASDGTNQYLMGSAGNAIDMATGLVTIGTKHGSALTGIAATTASGVLTVPGAAAVAVDMSAANATLGASATNTLMKNGAGQYFVKSVKGGATTWYAATVDAGNGKVTLGSQAVVDPLKTLDDALSQVDDLRSGLGAMQNRFTSAIDNLGTITTNLSAAQSRIQDADYAVEVSNMTRAQILQQAGTAVLAQANQVPQTVLSLLR